MPISLATDATSSIERAFIYISVLKILRKNAPHILLTLTNGGVIYTYNLYSDSGIYIIIPLNFSYVLSISLNFTICGVMLFNYSYVLPVRLIQILGVSIVLLVGLLSG